MKELEGFTELEGSLRRLENSLTDENLRRITRKGAAQVLEAVRSKAPKDKGLLREGIILKPEKSRTKGKTGYDVMMDPQLNDLFQKPIINRQRSKSPYGYYPASQEYGYFTRRPGGGMVYVKSDGSTGKMNKVPGKHYMLSGAEDAGEGAKDTIIRGVEDLIDKEF